MLCFLHVCTITRHMLVFFCPVTDISATVAPIGVKFCMMVYIGPREIFSPLRAVPPETPNPKFWA